MSTSLFDGRYPFAASLYGSADDPVDTVIVRDGVANGLLHAADSAGQVRVNAMWATGNSGYQSGRAYLEGDPGAAHYALEGSPFGPWPMTIHEDGTPYVLRVRVAARKGVTDATMTVVLAPPALARYELGEQSDHTWQKVVTGTTTAWQSGASRGPSAYTTRLVVPAAKAAEWARDVGVFNATSSGDTRSVRQVLVGLSVFGSYNATSGKTADLRLHALHAQEYVGT